MRFTTRQTLKHCVVAVAAALVGLTIFSAGASATPPSQSPEITAQPSNPNSTHAAVKFEYTKGTGETETITGFQCRQYRTVNPPANPSAGWGNCGSGETAEMTYQDLTNESQTFEVRALSAPSNEPGSTVASATWTQNIAAPSAAPTVTSQPDDPNDQVDSTFAFESAASDGDLVNRFQCRIDSTEPSGWANCSLLTKGTTTGTEVFQPGNGTHTFEVRAGNQIGFGPASAPTTWTVEVPNPEPSVRIGDVATGAWNGGSANDKAASHENIGDVNGDGVDDLAILSKAGADDGTLDVLFGRSHGFSGQPLGTQSTRDGFRILPPADAFGSQKSWVHGIGDQNGDGIDDLVVQHQTGFFGLGPTGYAVIYGGFEVDELPACPGASARCLSLDGLPSTMGYELDSEGFNAASSGFSTGDFDGDGTDDLLLAGGVNSGKYFVVKGKERSGTVTLSSLPNSDLLTLAGVPQSGQGVNGLGDVDGDGRDDAFLRDSSSGTHIVLYGRTFGEGELDLTTMDANDGFMIYGPSLGNVDASAVGDLNHDGTGDLAVSFSGGGIGGNDSENTVEFYYTPKRGSGDSLVVGPDMDPATGYVVNSGGPERAGLGSSLTQAIGDFNNDGTPDSLASADQTPVDGHPQSGAAYVLFGQSPKPDSPVGVGRALTADVGIGLLGTEDERAGSASINGISVSSLGDIDSDGLTDFSVGAPLADPNGVNNAGSVYIVPGKALINQVKTQSAVAVGNMSAVLNAGLSTNNRDSEVWFEYGTTDEYGSSTDPESFEASVTGDAASAAVSGLEKNTAYHYRAVAKNALGLVRYGDDRTFTTTNADDKPVETCDLDPTGPGCVDYCKANPTAKGCDGYDWCGNNPGKCSTGKTKARLALIATQKRVAVKRGRKAVLRVAVVNTGGQQAKGVKVCVKAPKRLVKVKKCVKVGKLASGKTRVVKIKVKAKRKKGKAVLKLTASGNKLSAKKAKAKVVIR